LTRNIDYDNTFAYNLPSFREVLMNFKLNRPFRIISLIVLFSFLWTFGGLFDLAVAAKEVGNEKSEVRSIGQRELKPEEKFQRAIEDITSTVEEAVKIGRLEDEKRTKIKNKKAEIESLDTEIKKQFKETEEKIKDLPEEIKQRHRDFVRHYEDNLNELKTNLDAIDKAETKDTEVKEVEKTRSFLEKVKPPKKHVPLDPNKLPHRTPEIKEFLIEEKQPEKLNKANSLYGEPILVASIGSLAGLLSSAVVQSASIPSPADLSETIEVQLTPEIRAKAAELGNNPVKIYEYVRNNFEYEPYYGSLKGAQQTLLERAGNDFDQASLLIALLRASNIPARYVYGTVEIPSEKLMNWVGGVTDPNTAATILATAGVPGNLLTEGGQIKYAQMEHVWVEAYVPYGNYRGARRDDSIKTWIPLDPSFKQYDYKRGMDLYTAMGINGEQYIQDYITDTSPSPIPIELHDLFPNYTISPYQFYSKRLMNYIDTNFPDSTIEDIIGDETIALTKAITKKEYPFFLGSLPYKVVAKGATYSSIPSNYRHSISFTIENALTYEIDLSYAVTLPESAGKRITLSYVPATSIDEALVTQYGGLLNVPPYLLNVKPVIKVNGIAVATGNPVGLGYEQVFYMSFRMPNKGSDTVINKVTAGDYSAIAIQYYKTPSDLVADKMRTLQNNRTSTDLDDLLGQMLYNIGISYMHHLNFEEELYAKNFQMIITKEPSEAMAISHAVTEWLWGVPYKVTEGGVGIDVDRDVRTSFPIDGDRTRAKDFMIVSGLGGSAWEDMILESFFNIPSVSASRLLKIAIQRGIPIFTIDSNNLSTVLSQLQVSAEVINDIRNSVNAGKKVIISKTNIQYNDWNGVGYIVLDPAKGTGAYMISGGLAGAEPTRPLPTSLRELDKLYQRICEQKRGVILNTAGRLIGSPYRWGCKDPEAISPYDKKLCKGVDCSGLVCYSYIKAGIKSVGCTQDSPKNANTQFLATKPTDYPFYVDLVFWKGTYDRNGDCLKNERDGATHVGIALQYGWMIHARWGKTVDLGQIYDDFPASRSELKATKVICTDQKIVDAFNNGHCIASSECYKWEPTGNSFESYAGYRYAPEFDTCQ
jgi:hypothetical protein